MYATTTPPNTAYPNLREYGWKLGVHKAPAGYEHPWLVVTRNMGSFGAWSRDEARRIYREWKDVVAVMPAVDWEN